MYKINAEVFKKKTMEQLIKITTNEQGSQVVSARDLHKFLVSDSAENNIGKDFSNWIKDKLSFGYTKGVDYDVVEYDYLGNVIDANQKGESDYQAIKVHKRDYVLTLDVAKEFAMIQRNDKGKEARQYFIECEKKLVSKFIVPQTFREALLLAAEQQEKIEEQQKLLLEQAPKVDFYDTVTGSDDAIDIGSASKVLKLKYGRTTLFAKLRDLGILMAKNEPYQKYIDKEYFRVVEVSYTRSSGTFIHLKTLVTQKGLDFIRKKLAE